MLFTCPVFAQETGLYTDKGRRCETNEDHCGVFTVGNDRICIVCDGVGGNTGGSLASGIAVETVRDRLVRNKPGNGTDSIKTALTEAMTAADEAIRSRAATDSTLRGMASTCLLALIRNDTVYYCHAGDSRLYSFTDDSLRQLTEDDSYMNLLIAEGTITPRQAKKHPLRRAITNALGTEDMVPNFCDHGFAVPAGTYMLMCTDGLYEELGHARIGRIIRRMKGHGCTQIARTLVERADKAGGNDNITVIIIGK